MRILTMKTKKIRRTKDWSPSKRHKALLQLQTEKFYLFNALIVFAYVKNQRAFELRASRPFCFSWKPLDKKILLSD